MPICFCAFSPQAPVHLHLLIPPSPQTPVFVPSLPLVVASAWELARCPAIPSSPHAPVPVLSLLLACAVVASARGWARHLFINASCGLALAGASYPYGQNLARGGLQYTSQDMVRAWVGQYPRYTYAPFNKTTGGGCSTGNWTNCRAYLQVRDPPRHCDTVTHIDIVTL